jgi:hypothetical protein
MTRMKHSEIQPGYFYSKGWIRYVAAISRGMVFTIGFDGYSAMRIESLQTWARERHTPEEAKNRFPKEFAEIAEQMSKPSPPMAAWMGGLEPWPDDAVKLVS